MISNNKEFYYKFYSRKKVRFTNEEQRDRWIQENRQLDSHYEELEGNVRYVKRNNPPVFTAERVVERVKDV